jgi:hypothetical protein
VIPIPMASFLAGSLLTILLPLAVLIALLVWYVRFLRSAPDPSVAPPAADAGSAGEPATRPGGAGVGDAAGGGSQPVS